MRCGTLNMDSQIIWDDDSESHNNQTVYIARQRIAYKAVFVLAKQVIF